MKKYIKYKRISEIFNQEQIQETFDSFITDGWEILYYNEIIKDDDRIHVTIIIGKANEGRTKTSFLNG